MTQSLKTALVLVTAALAAACNGNGNLRVDGRLSEASASQESQGSLPLGDGALVIESARVAVSQIEFEGGDEESDELEAEVGGGTIDLALDGSKTEVAANSVDSGVYHTLGMELRSHAITVEGTYGGTSFTYLSDVSPELEFALKPPVEVPAGGEASVGVEFDVGAWFVAPDGSVLDPTDEANRPTIEGNIMASMAAHAEVEDGDDGPSDD
ncbi:MAG TPA: hypothetical protein VF103_10595 [Polyangiaceae bacterium]